MHFEGKKHIHHSLMRHMGHTYVNTGAISTKIDTQLSCRIIIQKGKGGGIAINLLVAPQKKKQKVAPANLTLAHLTNRFCDSIYYLVTFDWRADDSQEGGKAWSKECDWWNGERVLHQAPWSGSWMRNFNTAIMRSHLIMFEGFQW